MPFRVALTFDAEHPDRPALTGGVERVLDALDELDVPATFFLQGRWVEAYPSLARRIADRHLVGNHSHYHARMSLFSSDGLRSDIRRSETAIRRLAGADPRPWFRLPFGHAADQPQMIERLAALGYRHVGWDVEAYEWKPRATAAAVTRAVVEGSVARGDGCLVLLHPWPSPVASAIRATVLRLREAGAELVRVDDLDLPAGLAPIAYPRPAAAAVPALAVP